MASSHEATTPEATVTRPAAGTPGDNPGPAGSLPGSPADAPEDAEAAVRNVHAWFEVNSGWAPPDDDTLAEWVADGVCRCPDDCIVAPNSWCEHGLASWALVLTALAAADAEAAARRGPGPATGPQRVRRASHSAETSKGMRR